jgi:sec-independent protein translocase protein TatA
MFAIGTQEGLMILAIVALLFGAKKIPELAKSFGEGIREFKKSSRALDEEEKNENTADNKA